MATDTLKAAYQLIAELLLSPEERDAALVETIQPRLAQELPLVAKHTAELLADPGFGSQTEYVQTLELSPACPLYLGSHLYDEPTTCSGIGTSGRNAYMLQLIGLYGHFGFELNGRELADFLPVMIDFLWISLETPVRDQMPLRRWCLEELMQPGLVELSKSLTKYKSPYLRLVFALQAAIDEDLRLLGDTVAWLAPDAPSPNDVSLTVLTGSGASGEGEAPFAELEVRA